jgi:hypothetical protein
MKTRNTQLKPAGPRIASRSAGLLIRLNTHRAAVLALFFAGATLLSTSAASADTITVINTNDSGPGSLRQALVDANNGDTINFDSSLNGQRITLTSGQLSVDKDVTISGPGAKNLAVDGDAQSRVFYVNPGKTVTISGLTTTNGHPHGVFQRGGGIHNDQAALTVTNCTPSGNSGDFGGGGIYNDAGALTVTNCTLSGNSTTSYQGGGIFNDAGAVTVANCMLSGNFAWSGGGIRNEDGAVTVTNCTFSGNDAYSAGGGIFNYAFNDDATLTVTNCTISGNSVGKGYGGGIFNDGYGGGATLTITNSTISGNSVDGVVNQAEQGGATLTITNSTFSGNDGFGIYNYDAFNASLAAVETGNTIFDAGNSGQNIYNYAGTVASLGYNVSSDDGGGYLTGLGDQINTDPMLGPLQGNGGPTFTHALLQGSPAIDAGDPNFTPPPFYDQRGPGFGRVVNGRIDVGSFEVQSAPTPTPRPSPTPRPRPTPAPRP